MPRNHNSSRNAATARRIETAAKRVPDGKVRCGACEGITSVTKNGRLRKHKTPRGEACPNVISGITKRLRVIPEVRIAPQGRPRGEKRPPSEPSRLDAGSACRECGKWLPGERSLCGACYVKGGRA